MAPYQLLVASAALVLAPVGASFTAAPPAQLLPATPRLTASPPVGLPDSALTVYGLPARPGAPDSGLRVPAGETREARFRVGVPGTYYYWGTVGAGRGMAEREWLESQLSGALVVDAPGAPPDDRVFVIGLWARESDSTLAVPRAERFDSTQGDSVRWRWVNTTGSSHPMHLHGFYFHLESKGNGA